MLKGLRLGFMRRISAILLFLVVTACGHKNNSAPNPLTDSMVTQYLHIVDSLNRYEDTISYSHRMLQAYLNKDTSYFRKMKEELDSYRNYIYPKSLDSSLSLEKLSDLDVDEAYRLTISQSFCYFGHTITISKKGDSINLQYLEYLLSDFNGHTTTFSQGGKEYNVDSNYASQKKIEKELKWEEWQDLTSALNEADFWGLKYRSTNPRVVLDGYSLRIDSYSRNSEYGSQIHSVARHSPQLQELQDLLALFFKLSGQRTMCEWLNQ